MHPTTDATLEKLERTAWFSRVGQPTAADVLVLASWEEAVEQCSSLEWENLNIDAFNDYRAELAERSKEKFRQWNEVVDELKKRTIPLVRRKIQDVVRAERLPKRFEGMVQWDILGFCTEAEYADVCPPGFSTRLGAWYLDGHFPCGWWGNFPEGKLIVY